MEFNLELNFDQLLSIIKQMPEENRAILRNMLEKDDQSKFTETGLNNNIIENGNND